MLGLDPIASLDDRNQLSVLHEQLSHDLYVLVNHTPHLDVSDTQVHALSADGPIQHIHSSVFDVARRTEVRDPSS